MGGLTVFWCVAFFVSCSVCSGRISSERHTASNSSGDGLVEPFTPMSFGKKEEAICPWLKSHNGTKALCADGSFSWSCVNGGHGQRVQCPQSDPFMCSFKECGEDHKDYCCKKACESNGGPRPCDQATEAFCLGPTGEVQEPEIGAWTERTLWKNLDHPYVLLFWTHVTACGIATVLSFKAPITLMIVVACSGLLWPISAMFNLPIWDIHNTPGKGSWWMTFVKWLIVDIAAGQPVLYLRAFRTSNNVVRYLGIWIYIVLGMNIVWTMLYVVDGWIRAINCAVGGFLTLSLVVNCIALTMHNKPLLEMRKGMPYGRATPFAWLLCYTFWNAMFVVDYSPGMTLQDILFWAMMYIFQFLDEEPMTVEYYFAYARPIQLAVYIATGCWSGIIPYFFQTPSLAMCLPLPVNDHPYFLFLCQANLLLSIYCTIRACMACIRGPPQMPQQRRLTMVPPDRRSTIQQRPAGSVELSVSGFCPTTC